jgi:hypothetical protein
MAVDRGGIGTLSRVVQQVSKMQFTTLTLVVLVSGAVAFPALIKPRQDAATVKLHQLTEYYMFNITNEAFITARSAQKDAKLGLDWSADGCSSSPDDPFGFDCMLKCPCYNQYTY